MKISKYFSMEESTKTSTGLANIPGLSVSSNIVQTAQLMDAVRELFNKPVNVSSWFRSEAVNAAVGGSKTSAHCKGYAIDFKVEGMQDLEVALRIRESDIQYDQLILEPNWVHISFDPKMRREELTLKERGGKYLKGIVI